MLFLQNNGLKKSVKINIINNINNINILVISMVMERFNTFRKVGKYEISTICLQSYPCKHYIRFENGETMMMSGAKIYGLLNAEGLSDKHFDCYAEYIRRRDFPTPEEIKQREEENLKIEQSIKIREKECNEQQKIVNQFKASSRIEKLKMKNNIH
jgi:hypothetical protein